MKGRPLEVLSVELLARGLSVRDREDAFKGESGRLLLSKTPASEIGERLWADDQEFATRDLSEDDIVSRFADGIAERIRPGWKREPLLAASGFTAEDKKVLLHLMAASKECAETVSARWPVDVAPPAPRSGSPPRHALAWPRAIPCWWSPTARPGIKKAIETDCRARRASAAWRSACATWRPSCPEDLWPEFKARATVCYQAPSRAIARDLADGVSADVETELPSATACFLDDFEACIAHLRMPLTPRRAMRTANLLEPLFVGERRRLKFIADAFAETGRPQTHARRHHPCRRALRAIRITDFERRQMAVVRQELDHEYEAPKRPYARDLSHHPNFSSTSRT